MVSNSISDVGYVVVYSGDSGIPRYFVSWTPQSKPRGTKKLNTARIYSQAGKSSSGALGYDFTLAKLISLGWTAGVYKVTVVPVK